MKQSDNFLHYLLLILIIFFPLATNVHSEDKNRQFYKLQAIAIDGSIFSFQQLQGKIVLISNIALKCGTTPQLHSLQKLYERFKGQGLVILGFPSNDFTGVEPKDSQIIQETCEKQFATTFPLFEIIKLSGEEQSDIFEHLTMAGVKELQGPVMFNFEKFLVNQRGILVGRYGPFTGATSSKVLGKIEELIRDK